LRGEVEVKALVTERVRPFRLDDQTVHEVGLVWHFGWEGFARGDIANIRGHCCPVKPGAPARNGMILNEVLSI
jgi:hypothetical protein